MPEAPRRRSDVECARIAAAFGVVWFHSQEPFGHDVGYGGLVFFIIVSVYFAVSAERIHGWRERAARLLVPCAIWSSLYGVISAVRGVPVFSEGPLSIGSLLATPSIHLWYLPFMFTVLVLLDQLRARTSLRSLGTCCGAIAMAAIASAPLWRSVDLDAPFGQYLHALPPALIGVFFASFRELGGRTRAGLLLGVSAATIAMLVRGQAGIGVTYLVGILPGLLLLLPSSLIPPIGLVESLSATTYGVYLAHPLFLFVCLHFGLLGPLRPVVAFLLPSAGIALTLRYLPRRVTRLAM